MATAASSGDIWARRVPASELQLAKPTWWLESRFHFNFADKYAGRDNFGVLRVINDDLVKAQAGFGTHPHRAMEIFSYVLTGELSHADSMGNQESLGRGCVQYLSAGTGITHSELNAHATETVRFLQVWIMPTMTGRISKPRYGSRTYTEADRLNTLLPIVQNTEAASPDHRASLIQQDVNVFVSELESSAGPLEYTLGVDRQLYLVCAEGDLTVTAGGSSSTELHMRDGYKVKAPAADSVVLRLQAASERAHFLFVEMAKSADE